MSPAINPPPIDSRTATDLAAQTEALVTALTGWQPSAGGDGDPGRALITIFGHYAGLVVERLNRLPDRNLLAFLNLIGAEPLAPRAARAPLTFALADGAPVDGVVPAGTQVAAPPRQGDENETTYETEQELIVSRARLVAARVYEPWTDRTTDCLAAARGDSDDPFALFAGTDPVDHELYLACDTLLADAAGRAVTLDVVTPDRWQWETWPIRWSAHHDGGWQPVAVDARMLAAERVWRVTIQSLPGLEETDVGGVKARWLRARLDLPLPPERRQLSFAQAGPVAEERPTPLALPFEPFSGDALEWYLDGGDVFDRAGAIAQLEVRIAPGAGANPDLMLEWQYLAGTGRWESLGHSIPGSTGQGRTGLIDGTRCLTQDGLVSFRLPSGWGLGDHGNRRGRWLRVRVVSGGYAAPPTITDLLFGWRWELPRVEQIVVTVPPAPGADPTAALGPELGYANTVPLDLGRDYAPFGSEPAYNDAFHLACEPALAAPGATVEVTLTLTNPAGRPGTPVPAVRTAGNPVVAWEVNTELGWRVLARSPVPVPAAGHPLSLTADGTVTVTLPADLAPATVSGEQRHWLRLRLVGGDYGKAATHSGDAERGYTPVPASYAPPLVSRLRITQTGPGASTGTGRSATTGPVTACMSNNGANRVDHTAAAAGAGDAFVPFAPLAARDPAVYLGFDQAFASRPINLFVQVAPPRPEDVAAEMLMARRETEPARIAWDYGSATGWSPLGALDATVDLTRSGLVRFVGPEDQARRSWFGRELHWLAARWQGGEYLVPPRGRQVRVNTVWASAGVTNRGEILGSSTGEPGQRFTAVNTPVLDGEELEVDEGGGLAVRWQPVTDLHGSGPQDRHYTIDRSTGTVTFGDGRQGRIPPLGQRNIQLARYRSGGGVAGNRSPGEVVELKSSPPYIAAVVNHEAAGGGFDLEPVDRVKERGPAALRHRDRAVTAQDVLDLAYGASPDVARASVITPDFDSSQLWLAPGGRTRAAHRAVPAGRIGVLVVPHDPGARPTPGFALLEVVRRHLLDRAGPAADLWVAGPEWVAVSVQARVAPVSPDEADSMVAGVRRTLDAYLHPLTGGPEGRGWAFGVVPRRSDLHRVLEATPGVDHVQALTITIDPLTGRGDVDQLRAWLRRRATQTTTLTPDQREWNSWTNRSLIFAAEHHIRPVLDV